MTEAQRQMYVEALRVLRDEKAGQRTPGKPRKIPAAQRKALYARLGMAAPAITAGNGDKAPGEA